MTSQRTRKLALSIQDELGIKYTEALRKAKIQIEERLALASHCTLCLTSH